MGLRRMCGRATWQRRAGALVALAALCASCVRAPVLQHSRAVFPRAHAAALAHLLADFSTYPHASGAWQVEEERGNYTEWRYTVSFACGARCAGAARVRATGAGAAATLSHGRAHRHTVRVELEACSRVPLLPWPTVCDEVEVEWRVYSAEGAEEGSVVEEETRAWCGVLRVLSGACARDLRTATDQHMARVRLDLSNTA